MKFIYAVTVAVMLSVGVTGQTNSLHAHKCLETIPGTHQNKPVWLTWRIAECGQRIDSPQPGNRLRVTMEDVARKNVLLTDQMVQVHAREDLVDECWGCGGAGNVLQQFTVGADGKLRLVKTRRGKVEAEIRAGKRKYAHAQQKAAVKPITDTPKPPVAIPVPEPEAAQLQALTADAKKAEASYLEKIKEPLALYKKEMELLGAKWDQVIVQAAAKSNLSFTQMQTLMPMLDESGKLVWKPKPEPPKPAQ